ncbi:MAG: macro domain-containing protein [Ruminococcus sp.]|jgi:O-acetyl-ADP-ribose deacetylase (regulator of RNase III)
MPFLMIRNDITKVMADAIVNPANEELLEGSGTSRAIYLAAGEEKLTKACAGIGHCDTGKAVMTKAFGLPAKYIIHAVGPVWRGGDWGEADLLYGAYMESMKLAAKRRLKSIAFPLLSSGNYRYPKDQALKTAIRAISDFLMEHEMMVWLVLYDRSSVMISRKLSGALQEYIDDHYVEQKDESIPEEGKGIFRGTYRTGGERTLMMPQISADVVFPNAGKKEKAKKAAKSLHKRSLENLVSHLDETFSQMLLRLIDERGLKDSYVYKKANIDRRHFSKIRKDRGYTPNRKTVLAFAIALELSLDETKDLMMRAGYAFSPSSKFDVIICYFIENREYDIYEINGTLFTYGQPLLGE